MTAHNVSEGLKIDPASIELSPAPNGDRFDPFNGDVYATPDAYAYFTENRGQEIHPDGSTRGWNFLSRYPEPFLMRLASWQRHPLNLEDAKELISLDSRAEGVCHSCGKKFTPIRFFMPLQRPRHGSNRTIQLSDEFGALLRQKGKLKKAIREFSKDRPETLQFGHIYKVPGGGRLTDDASFVGFCGKIAFVLPLKPEQGKQPRKVAIDKLTCLGQMLAASEGHEGKDFLMGQSWFAIETARTALRAKWEADRARQAAERTAAKKKAEDDAAKQIEAKRSQFFSSPAAKPANNQSQTGDAIVNIPKRRVD